MSLFLFFFVKKVRKTGVQKDSRPAAKFEFSGFRRRRREKLDRAFFIHSFFFVNKLVHKHIINKR